MATHLESVRARTGSVGAETRSNLGPSSPHQCCQMSDLGANTSSPACGVWDKQPEESQAPYLCPDSSRTLCTLREGSSSLALEGVEADLRPSASSLLTFEQSFSLRAQIPLPTLLCSHAGSLPELPVLYTYSYLLMFFLPPGTCPSQRSRLHLQPPAQKPTLITAVHV